MDLGKIIAFNLNKLRTERSLTLGQLAKLSGISKAILSDIEKGGSNPTINTIWKIANGLNVPYTRLMEVKEPDGTVVRRSDTAEQSDETGVYRVHCYFPQRRNAILNCFTANLTQKALTLQSLIRQGRRNIFMLSKAHSLLKQIPPSMNSVPVILWYSVLLLTILILTMARSK